MEHIKKNMNAINTKNHIIIDMTRPSGKTVREQLNKYLTSISYKRCFHLLCQMHYRLLSPDSFRAKMKFLLRRPQHYHLLTELNPLLPDEYQFSDEELRQEGTRDYGDVKKLRESVKFVNELTKVVDSAEDLGNFNELVKSHKRKEIDSAKFYDSAYKLLRGDFDLMKKLGNILGHPTEPSYIRLPTNMTVPQKDPSTSEAAYQVMLNNNSFRIKSTMMQGYGFEGEAAGDFDARASGDPDYYIYQTRKVIKKCLDKPCLNGMTSAERKHNGILWWESRRHELDTLLPMLMAAEGALETIKRGKWPENVRLRDHLVEKGVKVRLLEIRFGELEALMREPHKSLTDKVNQLRLEKEEVVAAIRELNKMHI